MKPPFEVKADPDNPVWVYLSPMDPEGGDWRCRWIYMTECAILEDYWDHWCFMMRKAKKEHHINARNCIEDFVVVHWAERVESESEAAG